MISALRSARDFARRLLLRLARHWLSVVLAALAIYISLPWLAPTLARFGLSGPADAIYTLYSPFCHQFAFRSPFLFGEQAFYPRGAANSGYQPFETFASESEAFLEQYRYWSGLYGGRAPAPPATVDGLAEFSVAQQFAARHFIGDATLGYKTSPLRARPGDLQHDLRRQLDLSPLSLADQTAAILALCVCRIGVPWGWMASASS